MFPTEANIIVNAHAFLQLHIIWYISILGKVTKFGPSSGVIPPSFEANPHCNCILEWLRNDGMGLEWQGWKFEWPLRRPPHPVILGPVQSFQGHPCHSSGMRAIVIPNHSRMTSEWWNDRMTLEWQNDFRMTEWLLNDVMTSEWVWNDFWMIEWPVSYTHLTLPTNREV